MYSVISNIDQTLLLRVANGDNEALHTLYNELYQPLLFFAESLIHDRAQSEDIVLVAFTKYWERRAQFDHPAALKSFLYTTVRHACYKYYHLQKNEHLHLEAVQDALPEADDYAESRMIIAEMIHHIHQEIKQLGPKYRDVIHLLFVEEKSIKEVADLLNITPENVRKRKERAIEMLRSRIVRDNLYSLMLFYLILQSKMP